MKKTLLTLIALAVVFAASAQGSKKTKVIAHRGYWDTEGSAQNSLASLNKAGELGIFGSEFDVHMTSDGVLIVNHDKDIDGKVIEFTTYEELKDHKLKNGETLPTLKEYIAEGVKYPNMKLILEIKSASTPEHETECVKKVLAAVHSGGVISLTEYIAFSQHVVKELLKYEPYAPVSYLNGDLTPAQLKKMGVPGLDYSVKVLKANPEWIEQARKNGMYTNVWTVNKEEDIRYFIEQGVDYITTDNPELVIKILSE